MCCNPTVHCSEPGVQGNMRISCCSCWQRDTALAALCTFRAGRCWLNKATPCRSTRSSDTPTLARKIGEGGSSCRWIQSISLNYNLSLGPIEIHWSLLLLTTIPHQSQSGVVLWGHGPEMPFTATWTCSTTHIRAFLRELCFYMLSLSSFDESECVRMLCSVMTGSL